jgi:hypothetical protein
MSVTMGAGTSTTAAAESNHGSGTANNSIQTIAHGLTAAPTVITFDFAATSKIGKAWEYAEADATNIYVASVGDQPFIWYAEV